MGQMMLVGILTGRSRILPVLLLGMLTLLLGHKIHKSRADGAVDLVLLLSLDVSASVDTSEYELVRNGLANALTSPDVFQAIQSGKNRAIAIAVLQWSGFQEQDVKIPWVRVASRGDLEKLAGRVRRMTRRYKGGATDIGGAIKFSREVILSAPFNVTRRTIDIAGDGTNNVNTLPFAERDKTVKAGVTINGLAVVGDAVTLVDFYKRFVIGGNSAFVEEARDYDSFETAMRRKLLREIGAGFLF